MASSTVFSSELYTEVVQVIRGGEPDEDGMPLAGRVSPFTPTYNERSCACTCAPLPYGFWEAIDRLDPYAHDSGIWLRVLGEEDAENSPPLPEGATLIETRRVSYSLT
ncbi:hypothetical protein [Nocardiopsis synnemataformans]|uniref:hypothetical protein n=1 Tax=Nocardiopsis synnemataformans TaxID=61305 RepID=UPI003EBA4C5B